jgi:hypothetical protein
MRDRTSLPLLKCRDSLIKANWDLDKAIGLARNEVMRVNERYIPTCQEIKQKLAELDKKRLALIKESFAVSAEMAEVKKDCTHDSRHRYSACGVETTVCDFCGHEDFVRSY